MQIGPYRLDNNVALAPMAGVSDQPFRQVCRRLGAGYVVCEMVSANNLLYATEKTQTRIDHRGDTGLRVVQLLGADPAMMAEAARYNVQHGAHIIDINMGCPAKKVCNKAAGAALLSDEKTVAEILEAVVSAVDVPVTLKYRTGVVATARNAVRIARLAESCGIQALALHGRTLDQKYRGEAEYQTLTDVVAAVDLPVWANGDIDGPEKAQRVLRETGASGVMLGRAAQGNPWLFREIAHFLSTGKHCAPPSNEERYAVITEHLAHLHRFYGEYKGVRIARKHIGWYVKGLEGAADFRQHVNQLESSQAQLAAVAAFLQLPPDDSQDTNIGSKAA